MEVHLLASNKIWFKSLLRHRKCPGIPHTHRCRLSQPKQKHNKRGPPARPWPGEQEVATRSTALKHMVEALPDVPLAAGHFQGYTAKEVWPAGIGEPWAGGGGAVAARAGPVGGCPAGGAGRATRAERKFWKRWLPSLSPETLDCTLRPIANSTTQRCKHRTIFEEMANPLI